MKTTTKTKFSTSITATKEKIWQILWNEETYKLWTSVFSEGSQAVSDWKEGSSIHFLDGKGSGMYSTILKKTPPEEMIFQHIGEIKDGKEQPLDEKTKNWSGSFEIYRLNEKNGNTELTIELDIIEEYADYFYKTFPLALQKVKDLSENKITINIEATVKAPIEKVWEVWSHPLHIMHWNNASDDWQTTFAENDLRKGGSFSSRMEARDGSFGFDFGGVYDKVKLHEQIAYTMGDGRKVNTSFEADNGTTKVTTAFEAESQNPVDIQRTGWQSILDNFKSYAEKNTNISPLHFEIMIDAPVENVYPIMIDEKTYREWTATFNPTSTYRGRWDKNAKILFVGCDEHGNEGGMVSRIKENIPNKFISIEHLGILKDKEEITSGTEVESWTGSLENYSFKAVDGKTFLSVDMEASEDFKAYFMETWPKALNVLKSICEK